MGILSVLSKKKKEGPVILSVETLVPELLKKNFENITGEIAKIELRRVKFIHWQIYLEGEDSGFIVKFFRNSTHSPLLFFFPSDFVSKYVPSVTGKDLQSKLLQFPGLLPAYLFPEVDTEKDPVINFETNVSLPDCVCSELTGKDEVLWQTSGTGIFNITFGSASIYLFLVEKEIQQFNNYCLESEITIDLLQNLNQGPTLEDKENTGFDKISNQAEFLLGRFFLSRTTLIGEHNAVSGFDTISWGLEDNAAESGVNFALTFTVNGKPYNVNYFIPAEGKSKDSLSRMMQSLIKAVLPMWRRFFEITNVGGGQRRGQEGESPVMALLSGSIKYQNSQIPIKVSLTEDIMSLFSSRFLESEEILNSDLSRIILLNQDLLHIFFKDNLFPSLTISEFFNLIDDFDLRRVVQNYFSGRGWSSELMQPLFVYSKKVVEKKKIYYYYDPLFNRSRFFSFLPKSQKDEWKRTRGASVSREEMISAGRKALKEIYQAYRDDHLDLSFKSSILLRNEFKIRGEEKIRKELDLLIQREPLSILLENKFARDVQNLLAGLTPKVLANGLVLYTNNLESLEKFMSRNYRAEVKDLIKIIQRKSTTDGFDMEVIRDDLLALHNGLKDLAEEEMV
ncbi:MAG: hypothetical protein KAR21_02200 [Spirochaetales bacterium]|nr:hypothetical protein [Spirochaetales bacterium]